MDYLLTFTTLGIFIPGTVNIFDVKKKIRRDLIFPNIQKAINTTIATQVTLNMDQNGQNTVNRPLKIIILF